MQNVRDEHAHPAEWLDCVRTVTAAADAEAWSAVERLVSKKGDIGKIIDMPWSSAPSPALRCENDAAQRLGLGHSRRRGQPPVPVGMAPSRSYFVNRAGCQAEVSGLFTTAGNHLLHIAAARGLPRTVALLLQNGADANAVNAAGDSAVDVAHLFRDSHPSNETFNLLQSTPANAQPRILPSWTDAWAAIRDAADEDAAAILSQLLLLDSIGDDGRVVPRDAEIQKAEEEMMHLSVDRQRTARANTKAADEGGAGDGSGQKAGAGGLQQKQRWATVRAALVAAKSSPASAQRQGGRNALTGRKRLETREWFDFCGSTTGFTLLHLACARNKPLCTALLLGAGADARSAALPAHRRADEETALSLATVKGHRRCVAAIEQHDAAAAHAAAHAATHVIGADADARGTSARGTAVADAPGFFPWDAPSSSAVQGRGLDGHGFKAQGPKAAGTGEMNCRRMQGGGGMRRALEHSLPGASVGLQPTWEAVWDEVRDAPDGVSLRAVSAFFAVEHHRLNLDKKRLDGYGRDAGRALAHLAASRGKIETLAALREFGASMSLTDLDGCSAPMLLAKQPRNMLDAGQARAFGFDVCCETRPFPESQAGDSTNVWQRAFEALRDSATEDSALPFVKALAAVGADAFGRNAAHRPDAEPHNLLTLAAARDFRFCAGLLRSSLESRGLNSAETGLPMQQIGNAPRFQRFHSNTPHMLSQHGRTVLRR